LDAGDIFVSGLPKLLADEKISKAEGLHQLKAANLLSRDRLIRKSGSFVVLEISGTGVAYFREISRDRGGAVF
jgi:hypothetical protein